MKHEIVYQMKHSDATQKVVRTSGKNYLKENLNIESDIFTANSFYFPQEM